MSLETIVKRIRDAFDMLNRRELGSAYRPVPRARPRALSAPQAQNDVPSLPKTGFVEEAIPWLEAVHRFARRLTRGDEDRASDLVQETYLRAYRSWHLFDRGTNCRSWLFTICKNTHLRIREAAQTRREVSEAELDANIESLAVDDLPDQALSRSWSTRGGSLFDHVIGERVVDAIDALPDDYRDVLVLSDLGDLNYGEIAEVLGIPIGTVKSRLFRARRRLQQRLIDYAADTGGVEEASA